MNSRWPALAPIATVLFLGAAGCGGSSPSTTATTPATQTAPPATATTGQSTSPESQTGGAGDEEPARSDLTITVGTGKITPSNLSVAAFIPVRITVRSVDGKPHTVTVDAGKRTVQVRAAQSPGVVDLQGLRPGSYKIVGDGDGRATLTATGSPGP